MNIRRQNKLCQFTFLLLICFFSPLLPASDLEKLLMPGELVEGHRKFEGDCNKCHDKSDKLTQDTLCLDCHDSIKADIDKREGFHGKNDRVTSVSCKTCHSDHLGRDAEIVRLNRDIFNHLLTDFPLRGAHKKNRCQDCHESSKKFSEAPRNCIACHKDDDRHKGSLGELCMDCHDEVGWGKPKFDHSDTGFRLEGKHRDVACSSCHADQHYKNTPKTCYSCHALNDKHAGSYGRKCNNCHVSEGWNKITFDHDRETGFKLLGKHEDTSCSSCHKKDIYAPIKANCSSCHVHDDIHKGRNGTKCDNCHTPEKWGKSVFDHNRNTEFPLRGAHGRIDCAACHRQNAYKDKLNGACLDCHRHDDVHKGKQGDACERCHDESSWIENIRFDHDLTRFPLIGQHAAVSCEECHQDAVFRGTPGECFACHKGNDVHKQSLTTLCNDCHNPNSWALWEFDHNLQTRFKLDGGHTGLACRDCHRTPLEKGAATRPCNSCHAGDDIHRGGFGQNCERCHITDSFKETTLFER